MSCSAPNCSGVPFAPEGVAYMMPEPKLPSWVMPDMVGYSFGVSAAETCAMSDALSSAVMGARPATAAAWKWAPYQRSTASMARGCGATGSGGGSDAGNASPSACADAVSSFMGGSSEAREDDLDGNDGDGSVPEDALEDLDVAGNGGVLHESAEGVAQRRVGRCKDCGGLVDEVVQRRRWRHGDVAAVRVEQPRGAQSEARGRCAGVLARLLLLHLEGRRKVFRRNVLDVLQAPARRGEPRDALQLREQGGVDRLAAGAAHAIASFTAARSISIPRGASSR